jgi:hypothetical protein
MFMRTHSGEGVFVKTYPCAVYPTSQQDGIGALNRASKTTIKTRAKQSNSAAHRPDTRFGAILLGSHGNIFAT